MRVLGIDAGGSKTTALLADGDGRVLAEAREGGANLQGHGELEVEKVLHAVIDRVLDGGPLPAAMCLGMAGVDREGEGDVIRGIMRRLGFKARTLVVNDALIALLAGASDGVGLVLIAGTGSIAYGVSARGVAARAGGWGAMLGDEGSGYWIGRRALAAVARGADGRGPATSLTTLVLRHLDIGRPDDLVRVVADGAHGRRAVAAVGTLVEQARAGGDPVAIGILNDAVDELVRAAAAVVSRLGMRDEAFPTVLSGGLLVHTPWLENELTRRLAEVAPLSVVARLDAEPSVGAVRLALAEARGAAVVPPYLDAAGTGRP